MRIPITPVGKPRMTQRDRWAKRPAVLRYYEYCDILRVEWENLMNGQPVPEAFYITFHLPMPPSWSNKKRLAMDKTPHQQRPDIDNLLKGFMDALCEDDSYIYSVTCEKYWSQQGYIELT